MSPRYSIVTTSIRGFDYRICITQSQIHPFKPTQRTSKSAPKFLPESQDENVCQPLCIGSWAEPASWSPKHKSSESRDIPLSPQICTARHTSSVLKSLKTQGVFGSRPYSPYQILGAPKNWRTIWPPAPRP